MFTVHLVCIIFTPVDLIIFNIQKGYDKRGRCPNKDNKGTIDLEHAI